MPRWVQGPALGSSCSSWLHGENLMKPRIGITVGDPAGIGPEIARKTLDDPRVRAACEPVLYGPPAGVTCAPGVLSADAGRAAYDAICAAVRDAQAGVISAIATATISGH